MKKKLIFAVLIILLVVIVKNSGLLDALIAFLLVGAIPGTSLSMPPSAMLALSGIALWALTIRFAALPIVTFIRIDRLARHYIARKERLPKRRFNQI